MLTMKLGLSTLCLVVLLAVSDGNWMDGFVPQNSNLPIWREILKGYLDHYLFEPQYPSKPFKPVEDIWNVETLKIKDGEKYKIKYTTTKRTICQIQAFSIEIEPGHYYRKIETFVCDPAEGQERPK